MRTEQEMFALLCAEAEADPRIRAAYPEGSRADPCRPKDPFQDYDIGYVVRETAPFRLDRQWIDRFGERLYLQLPDDSPYYASDPTASYGFLMQFADGVRLDLHVCTAENALASLEQYRVLVDKDGLFPAERDESAERYFVKRPDQRQFAASCNEFWWCLNNVAKGLWREEPLYVLDMLNLYVRPMLRRLLEWRVGTERDFAVNIGKSAKYLKLYLPADVYARYLSTYSAADTEAIYKAVLRMCELMEETALLLCGRLGLSYDQTEASNSLAFLKRVHDLPRDAKEV